MKNKSKFRSAIGEHIFKQKYALTTYQTWDEKAKSIVEDVCGGVPPLMNKEDRDQLTQYISDFKFLPGGRYIYYAGRDSKFYNNCDHFGIKYEFPQSKGSLFNQSMQIKESLPVFCRETVTPTEGDLILMSGIRRLCHSGLS